MSPDERQVRGLNAKLTPEAEVRAVLEDLRDLKMTAR